MPQPQSALALAGPAALTLYKGLLAMIKPMGKFEEEVKKTSIHLVRKTAFAGVAPRKEYLLLTIKSDKSIRSPRIKKAEQTSKSRWHLEIKLASADELDTELLGWLRAAYALSA
jgi:hypothetical protein